MSKDREAAQALNRFACESHFLGGADSSAFDDFLEDYFCRDDPANDSPGNQHYTSLLTILYHTPLFIIVEDEESDIHCDGNVYHNNHYSILARYY